MSGDMLQVTLSFGFFIVLIFITGFYCLLVTRNLIRALISIELLMKAVTLLFMVVGYVTNRTALAQGLIITVIVIEVVLAVVVGGVILSIFTRNNSIDASLLKKLKG
ncbi:MAG: NADH-quinone oxidoreductase subunit K [Candidatus Omnitrophota bacterium]